MDNHIFQYCSEVSRVYSKIYPKNSRGMGIWVENYPNDIRFQYYTTACPIQRMESLIQNGITEFSDYIRYFIKYNPGKTIDEEMHYHKVIILPMIRLYNVLCADKLKNIEIGILACNIAEKVLKDE